MQALRYKGSLLISKVRTEKYSKAFYSALEVYPKASTHGTQRLWAATKRMRGSRGEENVIELPRG